LSDSREIVSVILIGAAFIGVLGKGSMLNADLYKGKRLIGLEF
jgi:hypothetical protein